METISELELRLKQQEVARNDLEYKNSENEQKHQVRYQELDYESSKQEVIRRGIETLMNILRIENRATISSNGVEPALEKATRKEAEKKLNAFIAALKPL